MIGETQGADDDWEESDIESTDGIFALGVSASRPTPNFAHRNTFEDLDDDDDAGREGAIAELNTWAPTTSGKKNKQNKKPKVSRNQISSAEELGKAIQSNPRFGAVPANTKKLNSALRRPLAEIELEDD